MSTPIEKPVTPLPPAPLEEAPGPLPIQKDAPSPQSGPGMGSVAGLGTTNLHPVTGEMRPNWTELRKLAVRFNVTEPTILKEWLGSGSVRGLAGERAKQALAAWREERGR